MLFCKPFYTDCFRGLFRLREYAGEGGKGTYHKQCQALTATFEDNTWRSPHIIMKCLSKQVTQNDGRPELVGSVVKPRPNVAVFVGRTGLAHVTHIDTDTDTDRDRDICTRVLARLLPIKIICTFFVLFFKCRSAKDALRKSLCVLKVWCKFSHVLLLMLCTI